MVLVLNKGKNKRNMKFAIFPFLVFATILNISTINAQTLDSTTQNIDTVITKLDLARDQSVKMLTNLKPYYVGITKPYYDAYFEIDKASIEKYLSFIIRTDSLNNEYIDYDQLHPLYIGVIQDLYHVNKTSNQRIDSLITVIDNLTIHIDNIETKYNEEIEKINNNIKP